MNSVGNFDATALNSQVDSLWNPTYNLVMDYYSGKVLDFTSATDEAILRRIAVPSSYTCTELNTNSDSWIPTTQSGAAIPCASSGSNIPTATQCFTPTSAPNPFSTSASPCLNCMNTPLILAGMTSNAMTLNQRYTNANCATFMTDLTNTATRYYAIKEAGYNTKPIVPRTAAANTAVGNYKTAITGIESSLQNVVNTLSATVSSIIDPTYGLVAGFNCALLGADILLVNNTACVRGFSLLFFFRSAFGIAGIAIIFALCCTTCTGVRHYKQSVSKTKSKSTIGDEKLKTNGNEVTQENILPT